LLLSPEGRRGFTALADGTAVVWDLSAAIPVAAPQSGRPGAKQIAAWWADLAGDDAARAFRARAALTAAPESTVSWLRERFRPMAAPDPARLARLLTDLDSDDFTVRQKATRELRALGDLARPALQKLLDKKASPEVRQRVEDLLKNPKDLTPDQLRGIRGVEVLEEIATPQARKMLETLATGFPGARLTQEAKAALKRLNAKDTK
jgi:hypothetical protein